MTWLPDKGLWRKRGTYKGHKYNFTAKEPEAVAGKIEAFKGRVDGAAAPAEDITVWNYIQLWYPSRTAGLKEKTISVSYDYPMTKITPHIGNMLMREVKPLHIDVIMAAIAGMSSSINHKVLVLLKQIFSSAAENDVIAKNPCLDKGGARRRAGGKKPKKVPPLTRQQQKELAAAVKGTRVELFVLLCMYAGLRREEALGLLWPNVHLDDAMPYLEVRHTTTFDKSGRPVHSEDLKSEAAYRTIPIPLQLAEALRRRKGDTGGMFVVPAVNTSLAMSLTAFHRMWQGISGYRKEVAKRGEDGKPVKGMDGVTVKVKKQYPGCVGFHVTPRLLRHTYITELCLSGLDIKKIQYLAGHESAKVTLDIYADVVNNRPSEIGPIINNHFSEDTNEGTIDVKGA